MTLLSEERLANIGWGYTRDDVKELIDDAHATRALLRQAREALFITQTMIGICRHCGEVIQGTRSDRRPRDQHADQCGLRVIIAALDAAL